MGRRTRESAGSQLDRDRNRVEGAVRELRDGRRVDECFEYLVQRFSAPLMRQFISWGAAAEEARDLNQETFLRIFQDVESFQGQERLFESWVGWMWKIARTTWLRSRRYKRAAKRRHDFEPTVRVDDIAMRTGQAPGQLGRVLRREAKDQVAAAIEQLPEQERNCVILHYYQGLKTRESAVILRIAEGTVKAHLSHARAKLKEQLGDYFEFDEERQTLSQSEGNSV